MARWVWVVMLLYLLFAVSGCTRQEDSVLIADIEPPLAELPPEDRIPEGEFTEDQPGEDASAETQRLAESVEITDTLPVSAQAEEEELFGAAEDVIGMYRNGEFPPGEESRYAHLPESCSMDELGELTAEADAYLYPYCVIASFGNGTEMIMGMEYVSDEEATDSRPEGWCVAAVLFRDQE